MLCWIVHFTKVVQSVKNLSYFLKSVVVWVITVPRIITVFKTEEPKNLEEAVMYHHIWIKWGVVLFLSGQPIFQAATLVMFCLNYEHAKCVYFYDCIIRWLCWSASYVIGCHVLIQVAILISASIIWKICLKKRIKIEKDRILHLYQRQLISWCHFEVCWNKTHFVNPQVF